MHATVVGTAPDGRPYAASDPHLLRWVHVAEVDSFLAAHQRYGAAPLDAAGRDGYVADTARVAEALGVVDPPRTEAELARRALDGVPARAGRDPGGAGDGPVPPAQPAAAAAGPRPLRRARRGGGGAAAAAGPGARCGSLRSR